jgi:hypothetical protein
MNVSLVTITKHIVWMEMFMDPFLINRFGQIRHQEIIAQAHTQRETQKPVWRWNLASVLLLIIVQYLRKG